MANPNVSIEAHIGQCCQALSDDLAGRTPVYLDFRFWVIAREVRSGIRTEPLDRALVVWSRHLMVHHPCKSGRMRYGPDFTRERPHDRGSPSSDTT